VKVVGFVWGVGGILLLLLFAIARLSPMALELATLSLQQIHWLALAVSILYMMYAEGYKGFHLAFAPRVVARANYLAHNPRVLHLILAPLFCMGYIYATPKRQFMSFALTTMIICFVLLVRVLPQPWRGIIDAGVVAGLALGVMSICYFLLALWRSPGTFAVATDVPGETI
jgi:hypothetical protein